MENVKVSVIIPAYNSEKTLSETVKSVLCQTFKYIEIIIIDDGSKDKTAEIADSLAEEHENIRVLHKKNGGVSAARNDGIRAASGEWFFTLDADDLIEPVTVEKLYHDVTVYETDVSICGFKRVFPNGKKEIRRAETDFQGDREEFLNTVFLNLYDEQLIHTHSNKLYKTSIVRENGLYYDEKMSINEDLHFSLRYLRHCENISVTKAAYLNYIQHDEGESLVTKFNANGLETCFDVLRAYDELFDETEVDDETVNAMNNRMLFHICGFAGLPYYKSDYSDEKKLEIIKELTLKPEFQRLLSQTDPIGAKNRVAWFLLKHKKALLYHRLCKMLYKGGVYEEKRAKQEEKAESAQNVESAENIENMERSNDLPEENMQKAFCTEAEKETACVTEEETACGEGQNSETGDCGEPEAGIAAFSDEEEAICDEKEAAAEGNVCDEGQNPEIDDCSEKEAEVPEDEQVENKDTKRAENADEEAADDLSYKAPLREEAFEEELPSEIRKIIDEALSEPDASEPESAEAEPDGIDPFLTEPGIKAGGDSETSGASEGESLGREASFTNRKRIYVERVEIKSGKKTLRKRRRPVVREVIMLPEDENAKNAVEAGGGDKK